MPNFTIRVDGVDIPVEGAPNRAAAQRAVAQAVKANPGFLQEQRDKLVAAGGDSGLDRFLIGAGDTLRQGISDASAALLDVQAQITDNPFARFAANDLRAKREREAAIFKEFDDQQVGMEDVGEASLFIIPTAGMLARGASFGFSFGKSLLTNMLNRVPGMAGDPKKVANAVKHVQETALKDQPIGQVLQTLSTREGQQLARILGGANKQQAKQVADTVARVSAARARGRDAQMRVSRELRRQDGAPQAPPQQANTAAQGTGAATARTNAARQRHGQELARGQAQRAAQAAARRAAREERRRLNRELRELIKRAQTGQL